MYFVCFTSIRNVIIHSLVFCLLSSLKILEYEINDNDKFFQHNINIPGTLNDAWCILENKICELTLFME